jgi:hypothetical protein
MNGMLVGILHGSDRRAFWGEFRSAKAETGRSARGVAMPSKISVAERIQRQVLDFTVLLFGLKIR